MAQSQKTRIIDATTNEGIPFAQLTNQETNVNYTSDVRGDVKLNHGEQVNVSHPFYNSRSVKLDKNDSLFIVELNPRGNIQFDEEQLRSGNEILENYHKSLSLTSALRQESFDFLSFTEIEVLEQSKKSSKSWEHVKTVETITENRYTFPDKKYSRVITSHYLDGDSSELRYIPLHTYSISERNEYITAMGLKFYNPLFKSAYRQYDFALIESNAKAKDTIHMVLFKPKPHRKFLGMTGLLYFTNGTHENRGGYFLPNNLKIQDFSVAYTQVPTKKKSVFMKEVVIVLPLNNIPNFKSKSKIIFNSRNSSPNFDIKNTSNTKWLDLTLFDNKKDSTSDDTWMMTQINREQVEYIKKDTADRKFVSSNALSVMGKIFEERIGYRTRYFNINNVFAINRFEAVRIGLGLQSHENISDVFSIGGYIGYGIKDGKFKYGGNLGAYFGPQRNNLLSIKYMRDLREPGVVGYLDKRQDLVKDFFTSRMDDYRSAQVTLRSKLNSFVTASALLNNYSLKPLYDYVYTPQQSDLSDTQTFNFTETSVLFNIGTPFIEHPNLRYVIYGNKTVTSNLFLNITRGWNGLLGGEYDYWKWNGRLKSTIQMHEDSKISMVLDGGIMTTDQPYQVMYGGPGTEFKLTGIIIHNAFQTMKLYGFFTDRYIHSFVNYNFGNVIFKKSKFKPELALALNLGWGKIKGNKDIHEEIEVRDYSDGYYEAGVMINNLLRLKFYKYFYGGLGVGTFVGFGPDAEDGAFAIRLSYELGML